MKPGSSKVDLAPAVSRCFSDRRESKVISCGQSTCEGVRSSSRSGLIRSSDRLKAFSSRFGGSLCANAAAPCGPQVARIQHCKGRHLLPFADAQMHTQNRNSKAEDAPPARRLRCPSAVRPCGQVLCLPPGTATLASPARVHTAVRPRFMWSGLAVTCAHSK